MTAFLVLVVLPVLFGVAALRWSNDSRDSNWSLSHRDTHVGADGRVHSTGGPARR